MAMFSRHSFDLQTLNPPETSLLDGCYETPRVSAFEVEPDRFAP
jgi:hypothetical protein